jgi:hypothetical protein
MAVGRSRSRLSKFPGFILAATLAVIVSQPLGLLVQERVTTLPDVAGLRISGVTQQELGRFIMHKVELEQGY